MRGSNSIMREKGQVWIETVLYTLIGLALIGVVLAIITPKINEARDRIVVEQTIESLNILDSKITDVVNRGSGNIRIIPSYTIKKGEMYINATSDEIFFIISGLKSLYSEDGVEIDIGKVKVISTEGQKTHTTALRLTYVGTANISYDKEEIVKKFSPTSTPYKFSIENLGNSNNSLFVIDIVETSRR